MYMYIYHTLCHTVYLFHSVCVLCDVYNTCTCRSNPDSETSVEEKNHLENDKSEAENEEEGRIVPQLKIGADGTIVIDEQRSLCVFDKCTKTQYVHVQCTCTCTCRVHLFQHPCEQLVE